MARKPKTTFRAPKVIIGWQEWCAFPDLGLPGVLAKVDTGAKTSALHAVDICPNPDNPDWLDFKVHPVRRRKRPAIQCSARKIEHRDVTSSNGETENRPVVEVRLDLGGHSFLTELTLTNRDDMGFRMLLGRQSLSKRFVVDPALACCCGVQDESELYPLWGAGKQPLSK